MKAKKIPAPYEVVITMTSAEAADLKSYLHSKLPCAYTSTDRYSLKWDLPLGQLLLALTNLG